MAVLREAIGDDNLGQVSCALGASNTPWKTSMTVKDCKRPREREGGRRATGDKPIEHGFCVFYIG